MDVACINIVIVIIRRIVSHALDFFAVTRKIYSRSKRMHVATRTFEVRTTTYGEEKARNSVELICPIRVRSQWHPLAKLDVLALL